MAWNGSGVFSRTNGVHTGSTTWVQDRDAGAYILATRHDTHDEDLATGINACLTKNNETKPTADFCPNADATYDLGTASLRWAEARINKTIWETSFFAGIVSSNPRIDFDSNDAMIYNRTGNQLEFYIGGVQKWVDNAAGRYAVDGSASFPAWSFLSGTDTGLYMIGAANIGWACGGTKCLDLNSTRLEVTGNSTATGSFICTGTASSIPMPAFSATPVTMTAGYTNTSVKVSKDAAGVVHMQGEAAKDSAASGSLPYLTLASGYRPALAIAKIVRNANDGPVQCIITTAGVVTVIHTSSNNSTTNFDLSFPTT